MKKKQQQLPAVMDATGRSDQDATGRGSFLGTMPVADERTAMMNQTSLRPGGTAYAGDPSRLAHEMGDRAAAAGANAGIAPAGSVSAPADMIPDTVQEHLNALFGGENLSEEFMSKASVVFEAAINERTTAIREQLAQESAAILEEEVQKTVNELATRLDEYLNYVVEEWLKDNKLAVESGIRTEIAESFIGGLKSLFESHYIEVPEKKHDILEDLFAENNQLETALNEQIQNNIELNKQITAGKARAVFLETVSDLSSVDAERLASLAESVEFSNAEDFQNKLLILKENYLKAAPVAAKEPEVLTEQRGHAVSEPVNGPMSVYLDALSRQTKTY